MTPNPRLVPLVAGLGALIASGFMLYAGSPGDPSWWLQAPVFGTWVLAPYVIPLVLSWRWASSPAAQSLLGVAAVVVTLPAPFFLYDALVAGPSSTSGLVFLFLPVYQLPVVIPLSLAAWWAARKGERP